MQSLGKLLKVEFSGPFELMFPGGGALVATIRDYDVLAERTAAVRELATDLPRH